MVRWPARRCALALARHCQAAAARPRLAGSIMIMILILMSIIVIITVIITVIIIIMACRQESECRDGQPRT